MALGCTNNARMGPVYIFGSIVRSNSLWAYKSARDEDRQGGDSPHLVAGPPDFVCPTTANRFQLVKTYNSPRDRYRYIYLEKCLFIYLYISHVSIFLSPMLHVYQYCSAELAIRTSCVNGPKSVTVKVPMHVKDLVAIHGLEVWCSQHNFLCK